MLGEQAIQLQADYLLWVEDSEMANGVTVVAMDPPAVLLGSALDYALTDGILGPDELLLTGNLEDETAALAVEFCLIEANRQARLWPNTPGGSPSGSWSYDSSSFQTGDWISQTLTVSSLDKAGNVSSPLWWKRDSVTGSGR